MVKANGIVLKVRKKKKLQSKLASKFLLILFISIIVVIFLPIFIQKFAGFIIALFSFFLLIFLSIYFLREVLIQLNDVLPDQNEVIASRLIVLSSHLENYLKSRVTNIKDLKLAEKSFNILKVDLNFTIKVYKNNLLFDSSTKEFLMKLQAYLVSELSSFFKEAENKSDSEFTTLKESLKVIAMNIYNKKFDRASKNLKHEGVSLSPSIKEKIKEFLFNSQTISYLITFLIYWGFLTPIYLWVSPFSNPDNMKVFLGILVLLFSLASFKKIQSKIQGILNFFSSKIPLRKDEIPSPVDDG